MKTSETLTELYKDYIEAQIKLNNIAKDSSGYNYKYTSLEKLLEYVKPILHTHGLAVMQFSVSNGVITRLIHKSGEWIETELFGDTIQLAKMNAYQVQGSQHTYYRRYALASICGIASDDDMDAKGEQVQTQPTQMISDAQLKQISDMISVKEVDIVKVLAAYKVATLKELTAQNANILIAQLQKK